MTTKKIKPGVCPDCGSTELLYVQRVTEFHAFDQSQFPNKDGYVDLISTEDSVTDDSYTPHVMCGACRKRFEIDGSPFTLPRFC